MDKWPHFFINFFCSTISKSILQFLLSSSFRKLFQLSGQDLKNCKQTYCQLPPSSFTINFKNTHSHISMDIFLRGLSLQESFLIFYLNLYIPPWLWKSFKFIVLGLLQIHLWVKNWIYSILLMPPSETLRRFYHYPPVRRELPISPE